jgi:transposase
LLSQEAIVKNRAPSQQTARQRAEVIMKVRCGLLTASQAARQLGVSRKTYYKWEERGLSALLGSLEDQPAGRPAQPVDRHRQALEKQLVQAQRETALMRHKMALKDVLAELKLDPTLDRAKKK